MMGAPQTWTLAHERASDLKQYLQDRLNELGLEVMAGYWLGADAHICIGAQDRYNDLRAIWNRVPDMPALPLWLEFRQRAASEAAYMEAIVRVYAEAQRYTYDKA